MSFCSRISVFICNHLCQLSHSPLLILQAVQIFTYSSKSRFTAAFCLPPSLSSRMLPNVISSAREANALSPRCLTCNSLSFFFVDSKTTVGCSQRATHPEEADIPG